MRAAAAIVGLALVAGPIPAPLAGNYYVDASSPNCSPSGPGTEAQPYCSITAVVNARALSGNTILVKPGIYREQVTVRSSGSAGNPIVIKATGPNADPFGISDAPHWITSTPAAETRFRFKAWVRSSSGAGTARLRIREVDSAGHPRGPLLHSNPVRLDAEWQLVALEYLCRAQGSTIEFSILDAPTAAGESFDIDDVSIQTVADRTPFVAPGEASTAVPVVFPNPMPGQGSLRFSIARAAPLKVEIYDVTGRVIRTLADEPMAFPGTYEYALDDLSDQGRRTGAGVYFYLIRSGDLRLTGRFLTVR